MVCGGCERPDAGRLATKAASVLSGKLNPQYVPYIDMGDHVIVITRRRSG